MDELDIEQMVLGEAGESWDYDDGSTTVAVDAAVEVSKAEEPDLWFAEKHFRQIRRINSIRNMEARAFEREIDRLKEMLAEINDRADSKVGWHEAMVEGFHRALDAEGVLSGSSLVVPSGKSTLRKASAPKVEFVDEEAFREYVIEAEADGLLNSVKAPSPNLGAVKKLKRRIESDEPGTRTEVVDDNGVVVPGVVLVFGHKTHSVKVSE